MPKLTVLVFGDGDNTEVWGLKYGKAAIDGLITMN